ncbi:MAG: hypothetical protein L0312_03460 [Acidobacteria bacterium]|nr:hypothetical protein [Acidobacteriota bacterium]
MSDKDEGGSEPQGQARVAAELENTWNELEAGKQETLPSNDDGPARDDKGRFVAKQGDEGAGDTEAGGDTNAVTEAVQSSSIAPPEHWSQADKDVFSSLPDEAKPLYLEKVKSLESGYNKKFEEVANERKTFESHKWVRDVFEPYRQQLEMHGTTPEAYTRKLIAIGQQLQANPRQTLEWLAQQYGVDLATPQEPSEYQDPEVAKLKAAISDLQSHIQLSERQQQEAITAQMNREWQGFVDAKDASGNPTHPKAEDLKLRMGSELHVSPPQPGESTSDALKRAYEAVKWTDPEVRQSILEAETKAKQAEALRKADLEKAKAAGRTVKPRSIPATDTRPVAKGSWKDELEANWEQLAS